MKKNAKHLLALLMAVAMLLALTACGGGSSQSAPAAEADTAAAEGAQVFKLGGVGPLTGAAAIYGNAHKNGMEIAVKEINALGGDIQFEMNFQDDEHDAEKSVNAYNNLKDWGMQILVGPTTTTPALAVSAEVNTDRIFMLTPSASALTVVDGKDNVYQVCFTDPNQGTASAQYIDEQSLGENIAIIYNNADAYSTGIYNKFMEEAEARGLNVVSVTTFTDDTTDFSVQVADARDKGADLLFLPMYYTPASLIFAKAAEMEYKPFYFGVDGMDGILTLEGFDTALAEGVILLTPFSADATDEKTVNFVSQYQEAYGETPNQFAADGYDCVYAIYEALQQGDITADMSTEDICSALMEVFNGGFTFDGITGEGMTWNANGEVSKDPKGMVIENGAYVGMD